MQYHTTTHSSMYCPIRTTHDNVYCWLQYSMQYNHKACLGLDWAEAGLIPICCFSKHLSYC
jgi:hypothetical protein